MTIIHHTDPDSVDLVDGDMRGPEGSRFSNWHLLQDLRRDGMIFFPDGTNPEEGETPRSAREILVYQCEDYNGQTHEWRLAREASAHDLNYSPPIAYSIYDSGQVYMGPEEGGWHWTFERLHAIVLVRGNEYHPENQAEAKATAEYFAEVLQENCANSDGRFYATSEHVIGLSHSVGHVYYC